MVEFCDKLMKSFLAKSQELGNLTTLTRNFREGANGGGKILKLLEFLKKELVTWKNEQ